MEALAREIPIIRFPNRYICKDGSYRWLEWTARSYVNGRDIYAIAYGITDRKLVEEKLERITLKYEVREWALMAFFGDRHILSAQNDHLSLSDYTSLTVAIHYTSTQHNSR